MKVCTDACILGAWAVQQTGARPVSGILDIGCGTGLLSLMLAQQVSGDIEALDIDLGAFRQATENCNASPWQNRIRVINNSLQEFQPGKKYGLMISNPPFFESGLKSADEQKNAAKHDTTLRVEEVLEFISIHLEANGRAYLMIPFHRAAWAEEKIAEQHLFIREKLQVRQSDRHPYFRNMYKLALTGREEVHITELVIRRPDGDYTEQFKGLLHNYYLQF